MCTNSNTRLLLRLIIDIFLLACIYFVALVVLPQFLRTQHRGFFCGDESLLYPYKEETLLNRIHITILIIAVPGFVVVCMESLRSIFPSISGNKNGNGAGNSHSNYNLNHIYNNVNVRKYNTTSSAASISSKVNMPKPPQRYIFMGVRIPTFVSECYNMMGIYLFGLALVLIATICSKSYIGRLSPNFFELCQPLLAGNITACTDISHFGRYLVEYSCSADVVSANIITSMRQSFPSSHASGAAYAMTFVTLYLQARLYRSWLSKWRAVLQFAAMMAAVFVALERYTTNRHHWSDIFCGFLMGSGLACFVAIAVAQLFRTVPIKVKKVQRKLPAPVTAPPPIPTLYNDNADIYGYYTIMPNTRYFY